MRLVNDCIHIIRYKNYKIRYTIIKGIPYICAKDTASALGYINTRDIIGSVINISDRVPIKTISSGSYRCLHFITIFGVVKLLVRSSLLNDKIVMETFLNLVLSGMRSSITMQHMNAFLKNSIPMIFKESKYKLCYDRLGYIEFIEIRNKKYSFYDILGMSYKAIDIEYSEKLMLLAYMVFYDNPLYDKSIFQAVIIAIISTHPNNEYHIYDFFRRAYKYIFGFNMILEKVISTKNIPDFLMKDINKGALIPVEVKLNKFNERAKRQLLRYIRVYKASYGVAIGRELTTPLPSNIRFISTDYLMNMIIAPFEIVDKPVKDPVPTPFSIAEGF